MGRFGTHFVFKGGTDKNGTLFYFIDITEMLHAGHFARNGFTANALPFDDNFTDIDNLNKVRTSYFPHVLTRRDNDRIPFPDKTCISGFVDGKVNKGIRIGFIEAFKGTTPQ